MTESIIPKKTNQTWSDYFIERMKDKGLNPNFYCCIKGMEQKQGPYFSADGTVGTSCEFTAKYGNAKSRIKIDLDLKRNLEDTTNWTDLNNLDLVVTKQRFSLTGSHDYPKRPGEIHPPYGEFYALHLYFEKSHRQDEKIEIFFQEELEKDIKKIVSKFEDISTWLEGDLEKYLTYRIHDISIGEELINTVLDYVVKKEKEAKHD